MVGADDGSVEGADAAGEQAEAVPAETADDGAAGAGTERRGTDAGLAGEQIAEGGGGMEEELAAGDDGGGLGEVGLAARVGRGGDDEVFEGDGFVVRTGRVCEGLEEKEEDSGTRRFGHGGAE